MTTNENTAGQGVPVTLRHGRTVYFHALSWAVMKRLRPQRDIVYGQTASAISAEWEDAVFELFYASITMEGDAITREEFAEAMSPIYTKVCFRAMTAAAQGLTALPAPEKEVADQGEKTPTVSPTGTNSTPTSSPAPDGAGSSVIN